jgi:hypothetical protein
VPRDRQVTHGTHQPGLVAEVGERQRDQDRRGGAVRGEGIEVAPAAGRHLGGVLERREPRRRLRVRLEVDAQRQAQQRAGRAVAHVRSTLEHRARHRATSRVS